MHGLAQLSRPELQLVSRQQLRELHAAVALESQHGGGGHAQRGTRPKGAAGRAGPPRCWGNARGVATHVHVRPGMRKRLSPFAIESGAP
jgi:hypothetical protein